MSMVDDMDHPNRMKILSFLVATDALVIENADGCRVNLSRLPTASLERLVAFAERIHAALPPRPTID